MQKESNKTRQAVLTGRAQALFKLVTLVVPLLGVLVLIGWGLNIESLKRLFPGLVSMNPMTATGLVLAGTALWLRRETSPASSCHVLFGRVGQLCAVLALSIGALKLANYLFGLDAGIDQVLFRAKLDSDQPLFPNRMAPNTALNFVLIGLGLLLLDMETRRGIRPAQHLAAAVGFFSLLAVIGYAYDVKRASSFGMYIPMALHTAFSFGLLALALFCARPGKGWMDIFLSDSPGGIMARCLLPALVVVLTVLGWFRLEGEKRGLYGAELGVTLYTVATMAIFAGFIAWTAKSLHHADAQRQRVEEEQQRFFTLSLDMLCIAGFDGYFKRLNPVWEKILGFTCEELLAKPFIEFIHPDDRAATLAEAQKIATGAEVISFENRYRCKDGSYRWFQWNATPVTERQVMYAAARDVTERKVADGKIHELNESLESRAVELGIANKELEAFSYSVSHDLRAPLRHIGGFLDLLQKKAGATLDAKCQRYVNMISESAKEMGTLIDDLLSFSRMGRAEMRATQLDLEQLAHDTIKELQPDTKNRDIVWKIAPLPKVQADPALMRQVMVNLISNALKYSRTRPRSEIELGCPANDNGEHVFFVRDNGVGFDMKYADKLFGIFQRLHETTEFEGTGIGLANVQRIIGRHGGRTWAEGVVDGGATFYFSIPKSPETKI